jgi:HD-GYP domain-containing protein (c-di-GMP phosphodiesterase class II)
VDPSHRPLARWTLLVAPPVAAAAALVLGAGATVGGGSAALAFGIIVTLTLLCAIGGVAVIVVGWRRQIAEIALLGASLTVASVLPLAHGLTIPGVLYGPNAAVMTTAFIAAPLALLVGAPLFAPGLPAARRATRHWRAWTLSAVAVGCALAAAFLVWPDLLAAPDGGSPVALAVAAFGLAGFGALSLRQLRLYRIGGRAASLVASAGFAYLGLSSLVWLGAAPFSLGWWLAHAADAGGVLAAVAGLTLAHLRDRDLVPTLRPVVNRDPLIALELGLTPVVHRFVADLARKDRVTRDHVVRVAELAMRAGVRRGLGPARLRALGIGALLHDVGKLGIPTEILTKTGSLTAEEFETMKRHTLIGEELLSEWPILRDAAPLVRAHHERADGTGYPDGLPGERIPLEASIISVCDSWDAMTSDRPYRRGMEEPVATAILHDGAGTQWDAGAVALVVAELEQNGRVVTSTYDAVGEDPFPREAPVACVCFDALPDGVHAHA